MRTKALWSSEGTPRSSATSARSQTLKTTSANTQSNTQLLSTTILELGIATTIVTGRPYISSIRAESYVICALAKEATARQSSKLSTCWVNPPADDLLAIFSELFRSHEFNSC